jgi:hypothetical protein
MAHLSDHPSLCLHLIALVKSYFLVFDARADARKKEEVQFEGPSSSGQIASRTFATGKMLVLEVKGQGNQEQQTNHEFLSDPIRAANPPKSFLSHFCFLSCVSTASDA